MCFAEQTRWAWKIFMYQKAKTFSKINGWCQKDIETSLKYVATKCWGSLSIESGFVWMNKQNLKTIAPKSYTEREKLYFEGRYKEQCTSRLVIQSFGYHWLIYYMTNSRKTVLNRSVESIWGFQRTIGIITVYCDFPGRWNQCPKFYWTCI